MTFPASVDLRASINEVYDQAAAAACYPHAVVNALEAMHDHVGDSKRFSRSHLWHWARFWSGMQGVNTGVQFPAIERTLTDIGVASAAAYPWDYKGSFASSADKRYRIVRSRLDDGVVPGIKRLLCMGIPVIWVMRVTPMFGALAFYKDWRTSADLPPDTSQVMGEHAVCIMGYDDAVGRFLVENSYGKNWGDGGFFGVPYASIQPLSEGWQHIDVSPLPIQPVPGYDMTTPSLSTVESIAFIDRSKTALLAQLMTSFEAGVQPLIDACIKWGVSDKHLEQIAGWQRGSVRAFKLDNPGLVWDGFVWDQI